MRGLSTKFPLRHNLQTSPDADLQQKKSGQPSYVLRGYVYPSPGGDGLVGVTVGAREQLDELVDGAQHEGAAVPRPRALRHLGDEGHGHSASERGGQRIKGVQDLRLTGPEASSPCLREPEASLASGSESLEPSCRQAQRDNSFLNPRDTTASCQVQCDHSNRRIEQV